MLTHRGGAGCGTLHNFLFVAGGDDRSSRLNSVEMFDPHMAKVGTRVTAVCIGAVLYILRVFGNIQRIIFNIHGFTALSHIWVCWFWLLGAYISAHYRAEYSILQYNGRVMGDYSALYTILVVIIVNTYTSIGNLTGRLFDVLVSSTLFWLVSVLYTLCYYIIIEIVLQWVKLQILYTNSLPDKCSEVFVSANSDLVSYGPWKFRVLKVTDR